MIVWVRVPYLQDKCGFDFYETITSHSQVSRVQYLHNISRTVFDHFSLDVKKRVVVTDTVVQFSYLC